MREWARRQLGQLVAFQKGRKVEVSDHPREGFEPYLGAALISGGEGEHADTRGAVMATPADVLMLWDGERSGLVGKGRQGVVSSTVARLTPSAEVDGTFLYYALDFKFDWIQGRRTGTGVPHVPKDLGRILCIDYPTETRERSRIAEILSTLDEAIEQTEGLIAKTQAIKAGLMHDLLTRGVTANGELRPSREEAPQLYKDSPLGWIPNEWDVVSVDDLCEQIVDCPHSTPEYVPHGIPCIRTADMLPGVLLTTQALCVTERAYRERIARLAPRSGDVIYSREGERLGIASPVGNEPVCLGQRVMLLRPSQDISPEFMLWSMNSEKFYRSVISGLGATTSPHVNVGDIKRKLLPRPARAERTSIGRAISNVQGKLQTDVGDCAKLKTIRIGLMHDLLTGRVPVPLPEPEALAADA